MEFTLYSFFKLLDNGNGKWIEDNIVKLKKELGLALKE
jgi:hypothetical protein